MLADRYVLMNPLGMVHIDIFDSVSGDFSIHSSGSEAVLLMMKYGVDALKLSRFVVKIGMSNTASIAMFRKLHFVQVGVGCALVGGSLFVTCYSDWGRA